MSVWETLSKIDCNEHVDSKGGYSYLSWTWAWAMVKQKFPSATYTLLDDLVYPNGTMEVRVSVQIEDLEHTMWLPVLDFKNKSITDPSSFDINSARMRCLVKCLAMFGLGHYIYAGESVPQAPVLTDDQRGSLLERLANASGAEWAVLWETTEEATRDAFYNSAEKGEKVKFKERINTKANEAKGKAMETANYVRDGLKNGDNSAVKEALNELDQHEKKLVWRIFTELEQTEIKGVMG